MWSRWWLAIGILVTHFDHHFSRKSSQQANDLLSPRCQKWALTLFSIWCHVSWVNYQTKQDFWMTDHIPPLKTPATWKRQIFFFFINNNELFLDKMSKAPYLKILKKLRNIPETAPKVNEVFSVPTSVKICDNLVTNQQQTGLKTNPSLWSSWKNLKILPMMWLQLSWFCRTSFLIIHHNVLQTLTI